MGTRVSPTFANIFMANFEGEHVYAYPHQPTSWLRFIDDIFMLWDHGHIHLNNFFQHINQVHHQIQVWHSPQTFMSNPETPTTCYISIQPNTVVRTSLMARSLDCDAFAHTYKTTSPTV